MTHRCTHDPTGIYLLTGCPAGHQLINYLEADSAKAFFHDAQLCMPCTVNQYLSPLGSCQVRFPTSSLMFAALLFALHLSERQDHC